MKLEMWILLPLLVLLLLLLIIIIIVVVIVVVVVAAAAVFVDFTLSVLELHSDEPQGVTV